jgi:hypothetical protein
MTAPSQLELAMDSAAVSGCVMRLILGLCECGSPIVKTLSGDEICEKTADKYEATYGKRIKV